ncbi:MAG TPA: Ku protein [Alphaproteobacteria bacterium]|jgi:DNA end-binding protein Ku
MPRPIWEGHLQLSLVSCPVALYNATTATNDISFHWLHKKTNNRIRMLPHDPELGEVERKDLVKGFEITKNHYVVVTPKEIENVRLPSTKTIDIEEFVDAADIDRIYWNHPYYLVPNGKTGNDAYAVIRQAMEKTAKLALGRLVMHSRERIVALEPRGNGLLLSTLRSRDEIVDEKEYFGDIKTRRADKKMLDIAEKIIEQQAAAFEPNDFKDRYEDALRALIKRKEKGQKIVAAEPEPEDEKVVDLMEALRKSLAGKGDSQKRAARFLDAQAKKKAPARKKPAAKRKRPAKRKSA